MRNYLKELRLAKNVSQQDVAKCMGIKRQYYNLIENGVRQKNMSLSVLEKLAGVFEVPVTELIEAEQRYRNGEGRTAG